MRNSVIVILNRIGCLMFLPAGLVGSLVIWMCGRAGVFGAVWKNAWKPWRAMVSR